MSARRWIASVGASLLLGGWAFAASDEELGECRHQDDDRRVAGCTRIIENPANSAQHLAIGYNNRGLTFLNQGQIARALPDLNEAIRLNPNDARYYGNRAKVHVLKKEFDRAIADSDQSLRIDAGYANAYLIRGSAFYAKGDSARALADYSKAIQLGFNGSDAHHNRAIVHVLNRKYDLAIADYTEAIRRRPNADSYNNRGHAHASKNDLNRAIADFAAAINSDATYVLAYVNRGASYERLGRKSDAISDYRKALLLDPAHKDALSGLKRLGAKPF